MTDWRSTVSETRPMLSLGKFTGSISLNFENDGELTETEIEGEDGESEEIESVKFAVTYEGGAEELTDQNDNDLEDGEGYYLYTGSSRLLNELKGLGPDLEGAKVEIMADGRNFDRSYNVSLR